MNKFIIRKKSIIELVEHIIERNKDIRLFRMYYFRNIRNFPIRFSYLTTNSISLKIDIDARFGVDILKSMDKVSGEIKSNLIKYASITAQSIELTVKGIFDEEKNKETAQGN